MAEVGAPYRGPGALDPGCSVPPPAAGPADGPVLGGVRPGVVTLPVADGKPVPLPDGLVVDPAPVLPDPVTLPLPAPLGVPSVPPEPVVPLGAIVPPAPVLPLWPIVPPEVEVPPEAPPALPPAEPPAEPPPEPPPDWAYAAPAVAANRAMVRIARFMEFTPVCLIDWILGVLTTTWVATLLTSNKGRRFPRPFHGISLSAC